MSSPRRVLCVAIAPFFLLPPADAAEFTVPASVPSGLEADATDALNAFLRNTPDHSTVSFPPGAVYRVEGTLLLEKRMGLIIEGNGATIRATDSLPDYAKAEDYNQWKHVRTRSQWRVLDSDNIVFRDLNIIGACQNAGREGEYDANREAQHAFDILGATDVLVESVHVTNVWGDGVYISKESQNVTVRNSRIEKTGRQGIAIGNAFGVLIENNDLLDSRRGLLDIEPYGKEWACGDIRVIGNRFGDSRLLALPMGGSGSTGAVLIANNSFTGPNGTPLVSHHTKTPEVKRGPFFFVGNTAEVGGSPAPGLKFSEVMGVLIAGNRLAFPESRRMNALSTQAGPVGVFGNRFPGASELADAEVTPMLIERGNTFTDADAIPARIEILDGGYAVKLALRDGVECVGIMRAQGAGGPELQAFGLRTTGQWVWELRKDGKAIEKAES